jgi:molecular chaperone GrpE
MGENLEQAGEPNDEQAAPEAQIAELKDKWLRSRAEMENLRRSSRQELDVARRFGAAPAFTRLLDVLDNLRRAIAAAPADVPADFLQGLALIEQQFLGVLEEHGVSAVNAEPGQPLDPRLHQAIAEEDAPGAAPGTIVHAPVSGWRLHDRLLRPAQVVVARAPRPAAEG